MKDEEKEIYNLLLKLYQFDRFACVRTISSENKMLKNNPYFFLFVLFGSSHFDQADCIVRFVGCCRC